MLSAQPAPAADAPPATGNEARIKVTPFPPSVQIDTNRRRRRRGRTAAASAANVATAVIRIDSDRDFESFKDAVNTAPWIVGLMFLVVGIDLPDAGHPAHRHRLVQAAQDPDAERGAAETGREGRHAAGASRRRRCVGRHAGIDRGRRSLQLATSAYQQAVATRRRVVWSDLRKGVLLSAVGLSFTMYSA